MEVLAGADLRSVSVQRAADVSVLVLDNHELFSTVLMMALRARGLNAHRADLTRIEAVLRQAEQLPSGLVLLDLNLGRDGLGRQVDGVHLVRALRARRWTVLVVSDHGDEDRVAAAIAAGAAGVVAKSTSLRNLLLMVLAASAGQPVMTESERHAWLTRHRGYRARQHERARRFERLSAREREVLELMAQGRRATAIAEHFVVSLTTVRTQIRAILVKLEVNSQLEAVALAADDRC
ncbi:MAG: two-component system, NarL family, nitrate/nitrite response regulator NarL [Pseudonocardiales bacterium]|nr:two-component system, NarL family, nitrate/nitrite response regulator NarL [Pseudonocardiales bacterium]